METQAMKWKTFQNLQLDYLYVDKDVLTAASSGPAADAVVKLAQNLSKPLAKLDVPDFTSFTRHNRKHN